MPNGAEPSWHVLATAARLVSEAAGQNLDAVLDTLSQQTQRLLAADDVVINLAADDGQELVRRRIGKLRPRESGPGEGSRYVPSAFVREAIALRRPIFSPDYQADPRMDPQGKATHTSIVATMTVPLFACDGLVGAMFVHWTRPTTLTPTEIEMADALGRHAAVAIKLSRSLEEATRATADLRARERLFRVVVERAWDGVALLDRNGTRFYRTPSAARMLGQDPADVEPRNMFHLVHPEDRPRVEAELAQLIGRPELAVSSTFRARHADGSWRWLEAVGTNLLDESGVEAIVVHYHDVTERVEAEAKLQAEAAQKGAILDQMSEAVLVADRDGRVVLANRAAASVFGTGQERLFGLTPAELPWQPVDEDGTPLPSEQRLIASALLGETRSGQSRIRTADGGDHWVFGTAAPLRGREGALSGAILVARDVTERRREQAALERAREQAFQADKLRALGQMAGGVAHDLNQSLALVAAYGEIGHQALTASPPDVATAVEALEVTTRAAMDGGKTVGRLLTFARAGTSEDPPRSLDVREMLEEVAQLTAPAWRGIAQSEGRPVELEVDAPANLSLEGWAADLREALTNLVFNAIDALPSGGRIRLTARRRGDRVLLAVEDSGVGMSREVQARAFEPFFTTKGQRGSGLGLAVVFRIAGRHGGQLSIDSSPGAGTTVTLELPARQPRDAAGGSPERADRARSLRVLLVDDDPVFARAAALLLEREGHDVATAGSGEEALAYLDRTAVDAVVTDVVMGTGMNGWELARVVRERWPAVRIVISSGLAAADDWAEAAARGVDAVMPKPYQVADLRRALDA